MAWKYGKKTKQCHACGQWAGRGHRCPQLMAAIDARTGQVVTFSDGGIPGDGFGNMTDDFDIDDRVNRANEAIKSKAADYKPEPMNSLELTRWVDANGNSSERRNSRDWELAVQDTDGKWWTGNSVHMARGGFADERGDGQSVLLLYANGNKRFGVNEISAVEWRKTN